ncbi:MAG: DUF192 domain-containing protein [Leptolyngbyaceae cyanobacterium SL_7_1]|nr:DUF192 domain-containing protein [Leptolyngbyaceae cyanobacterium SL_7_1]
MNRCLRIGIGLGWSILLMGCAPSPLAHPPANRPSPRPSPLTQPSLQTNRGQILPISAQAIVAGQRVQLEVAQTPAQQAMGLMFRPALPDDRGMLFPLGSLRPTQFWMRNVPVPLDMIFLRDDEVVAIEASAPPCTTAVCPVYGPTTPINQVIELRGGRAAELGLQVGDRVTIEFLGSQEQADPAS